MCRSHKGHPGVIEPIRDHNGPVHGTAASTVLNICQIGACELGKKGVVLKVNVDVHENLPQTEILSVAHCFPYVLIKNLKQVLSIL